MLYYSQQEWDGADYKLKPGERIKYLKGLGSSTREDMASYFNPKNIKLMAMKWDDKSGESLDLAFNEKRADDRKEWLTSYDPNKVIDYAKANSVTHDKFVHEGMKHYSQATLTRAIPNLADGFKESQRKVLYTLLKKYRSKTSSHEIKVERFAGEISLTTSYHHGQTSLEDAIISMAQDYVGSNNLNLLLPKGAFGTRNFGGTDSASSRYIFISLNDEAKKIFRIEDEAVLNQLEDDGDMIEYEWFAPIIPMVLVNGVNGIATGFSSQIPQYDPEDIREELKKKIHDPKYKVQMEPKIRGWTGQLHKGVKGYSSTGVMHLDEKKKEIKVTELPAYMSTEKFLQGIEDLIAETNAKKKLIRDVHNNSNQTNINITLFLTPLGVKTFSGEENLANTYKTLGMVNAPAQLRTENMHLLSPMNNNAIKKYKNVDEIVEEFITMRSMIYEKRIAFILKTLKEDCKILDAKMKFIKDVLENKINFKKQDEAQIIKYLTESKYHKVSGSGSSGYEYLLTMSIRSMTTDNVEKLKKRLEQCNKSVAYYSKVKPHALWISELDGAEIDPLENTSDEIETPDLGAVVEMAEEEMLEKSIARVEEIETLAERVGEEVSIQ